MAIEVEDNIMKELKMIFGLNWTTDLQEMRI